MSKDKQQSDLFMAEVMAMSAYYGHNIVEETPVGKANMDKLFKKGVLQELIDYEPSVKHYIGIDNGVTGSIGMISDNGYEFHKTPVRKELNYTKAKSYISRINATELIKILSKANKFSHVMIERPMVNPSRFNATVSALRAFEATITILETLGLSYEVVDSKKWQKELLPNGVSGEELKPASLSVGKRLFPNAEVGKHTDMDGMLIAEYCRKMKR